MQPVVFRVVKGDATGFSFHCRFRLLHDEVKQLLQVIDGADESVHLIESADLQLEESRFRLQTCAAVHKSPVLRLRLSKTNGWVGFPLV